MGYRDWRSQRLPTLLILWSEQGLNRPIQICFVLFKDSFSVDSSWWAIFKFAIQSYSRFVLRIGAKFWLIYPTLLFGPFWISNWQPGMAIFLCFDQQYLLRVKTNLVLFVRSTQGVELYQIDRSGEFYLVFCLQDERWFTNLIQIYGNHLLR